MRTLGIDPGKGGAAVLLDDNGWILYVWDTPTLKIGTKTVYDTGAMANILTECSASTRPFGVAIEKVGARSGQGVTSMFSFGEGYGLWQGMVAMARVPITFYTPQKWKGSVLAGMPEGKGSSLVRAKQLWPTSEFFSRKKDEGRAEAALIAHYHQLQISRHA